jgi:uncharacterized protein (DUF697 family)
LAHATIDAEARGERLLTAVERLVDDCDNLIAKVEAFRAAAEQTTGRSDKDRLEQIAERIISDYSTRSAIAGGITAVPTMIPGPGSILAILGGLAADMTFMLKHEVEMILCLTYLYGYDIRDEKERWLAYVLAGVRTYEASTGRNYFVDLAEAQLDALPRYTPRELSKLAVTVMSRVALRSASRVLLRAIPIVGVAVGAAANKLLTSSVGWWCVEALERRRSLEGWRGSSVVDADVV